MQLPYGLQSLGIIEDYTFATPHASSGTYIVANVAATSVALTIANQPDVCRELSWTLAPGAAAITAGTLTVVYLNELGVTQTDVFNLATASGVSLSGVTTHGCQAGGLTSATIASIAGGSSPTIQMGVNNNLCLVPPTMGQNLTNIPNPEPVSTTSFSTDCIIYKVNYGTTGPTSTLDLPPAAVQNNNFKFTPNTVPNGTNNYYVKAQFLGGGAV
jgi:hypothetical protein